MSISKLLGLIILVLLSAFLFFNWPLKRSSQVAEQAQIEIAQAELQETEAEDIVEESAMEDSSITLVEDPAALPIVSRSSEQELPKDVDRMGQLFEPSSSMLPIVETITYSSRVDWLKERPAYLGDYAIHFQTPKHFMARSLKGIGSYLSEAVSKGDKFNVYRKDKEIEFHIVLDLSRLKMWVYYFDVEENEKVLLKSYPVCAGRLDSKKSSGCLTPTGIFKLGSEVAVYKPGTIGLWRNQKKDMASIFGVRWIPLEKEIANGSESCKGLGFQGVPLKQLDSGGYFENQECIGRYESNGCIRLLTKDIEELFAVVISKPTYVHIVTDFVDAQLPGKEKI